MLRLVLCTQPRSGGIRVHLRHLRLKTKWLMSVPKQSGRKLEFACSAGFRSAPAGKR